MDQVRNGLADNPLIYPQNLDFLREAILFLRLEASTLQAASFLDDRILSPQLDGRWVKFAELDPLLADAQPARPLHFIFHSGHVGSTLISRLIESAGATIALREPLALRVLATAWDDRDASHALIGAQRLDTLLQWHLALWGRGFADTRAVILKATSSAGRMCAPVLMALPEARALYLNLAAEPYLATLLAGENNYLDLRGMGAERFKRLTILADAQPPEPLHTLSLGELAALTWLTEKLTQLTAQAQTGARILAMDFDAFLAGPAEETRRIFRHLGLDAAPEFFARAPDSDVFKRYSKAPEHGYTPQFRAQILDQARVQHQPEIKKGLAWLERMAALSPAAARALSA